MVMMFAFGLMAKPMLVTLPVVLMLLDYWPLGRWNMDGTLVETGLARSACSTEIPFRKLVQEKIPFLVLASASCVLTLCAQHEGGAVNSLGNYSISIRIANAIISYTGYLHKMFWPQNLAFFYPLPKTIPIVQLLTAVCVFAVMTFISIRFRRKQPFVIIGWLWYVVTLLPVIGLIQVGGQSSADRYTYLPIIGIFILMVWWLCEITANMPHRRLVLTSVSGIVLTGCALVTVRQISYWQNNVILYSHALAVTNDNYIAHNNLGFALAREGKLSEASAHFNEAIRISPRFADAYLNLGETFLNTGEIDKSIVYITKAIDLRQNYAAAYLDLGAAMFRKGRSDDALGNFNRALAIDPYLADGSYNKGIVLSKAGNADEAIECFTIALKINPDNPDYHTQIGIELARKRRLLEAINQFSEALRLNPNDMLALHYLNQLKSDFIRPNVDR
jgi:Flp pilus assembly protein TadD